MRRAYYNQWSFHHGDAALPTANPDEQIGMAVYNIPAKITAWTTTPETHQNSDQSKGKSPRLLAILLVLFVIFLLAFTSTLIAWGVLSDGFDHRGRDDSNEDEAFGSSSNSHKICLSDDCARVAGDIVKFFDKTVNPCDDFYQFACGKYPQEVPVPRDKDRTSTLDQMEHKVKMQLRALIEAPITITDSSSSRLVKQFYRSCMDVQALQTQGFEPLKNAVHDLGGWPSGSDAESNYAWEKANAILRAKYGVHSLMIITVDSDFKNNSKKMIMIDQPDADDLNLVRAWKMAMARGKSLLHSALDSMVDLALEFGADRDTVISDMEEILLLEILLDNITLSEDRRRDRMQYYHPMSMDELKSRFRDIDWSLIFKTLLPHDLSISEKEIIFNVVDIAYFRRLQEVLKKFSKRTLANYHIYYLANTYIRYLAPNLRDLRRPYSRRFLKTPASSIGLARWEECVDETSALLSWRPVSEMYANRNITANVKKEVHDMFSYLQEAALRLLYRNDWMDNSTGEAAIMKLNLMALRIPDLKSVFDENVEDLFAYDMLNFTNASYFNTVVQLNAFRNRMTFLSLRRTGEDVLPSWSETATPASVNAFYRFDKNEVVLPTSILQYPLFSSQVPRYIQYSRLGTLAAHEIMHGYDDEGRQYDEYGNLRNWWTNVTSDEFYARAECLIEQYCNITDNISGRQLNGGRTLGENLADHGGINVAYDAYHWWRRENKIDDENRLPGLASFTTMQTFFLSFANVWCESIRPESLILYIDEDEHALGKYRVNVPLQNFPAFSQAFRCPLGSPMNPIQKCQVW